MPNKTDKFVGIQISPISLVDEGVEPLLDTLCSRFGINVLLVGTILIVGALTFVPVLALGPVVEHFLMTRSAVLF